MPSNDKTIPAHTKLLLAWTIIGERYGQIIPYDKLADLERASELHLARHPTMTAAELVAWIATPYLERRQRLARAVARSRPFTGRTPLGVTSMSTVWAHMHQRYGRAYTAEVRAHFEERAETFARSNPSKSVTDLVLWLREQNHLRKYPR